MTKMKNIRNPEYSTSKERANSLHSMVVDGEDAEAVLKYASRFLKDAENELLCIATDGTPEELLSYLPQYKAVHSFCTKLKQAANTGEQKRKVLDGLHKQI